MKRLTLGLTLTILCIIILIPRIIGIVLRVGVRASRLRKPTSDQYRIIQDNKYNRMSDGSRNERRVTYCPVWDPVSERRISYTGVGWLVPFLHRPQDPPMGTFHTGNHRESPRPRPAPSYPAAVTLRSFGYAKSI